MTERRLFGLDALTFLRTEDVMDAQHNMNIDTELGQEIAQGQRRPTLRMWRGGDPSGIGVSRKDVASTSGQAAMQALQAVGVTVVTRETGGTAVPYGTGVLHLSYILPRTVDSGSTDDYYRLLCTPLVDWLASEGVQAQVGALAGSYCDGSYNVLVQGKKLVGTAQAWRGGLAGVASSRPGYILAHACITVDVDIVRTMGHINRFYELADQEYRVNPDLAVSLMTLLPQYKHISDPTEFFAGRLATFLQNYSSNMS